MQNSKLIIQKSVKTNKKKIKRFYKNNNYSASLIGYDETYIITIEEEIIGSVIISYQNQNNNCALLHALLINKNHRNNSYANQLIETVRKQHHYLVCFTERKLIKLYKQNGFIECDVNEIPSFLSNRYQSYLKKNTDLIILIYNNTTA